MAGVDRRQLSVGGKRKMFTQWSAKQQHAIGREEPDVRGWLDCDFLTILSVNWKQGIILQFWVLYAHLGLICSEERVGGPSNADQ